MKNPRFQNPDMDSAPEEESSYVVPPINLPPPHPRRAKLLPRADHLIGSPFEDVQGHWYSSGIMPKFFEFCEKSRDSEEFETQMHLDLELNDDTDEEVAAKKIYYYLMSKWVRHVADSPTYPGRRLIAVKPFQDGEKQWLALIIHEELPSGWKSMIADFFETPRSVSDYLLADGLVHPESFLVNLRGDLEGLVDLDQE